MCPHTDNVCRPVQAEAFDLAMAELKAVHPDTIESEKVLDAVMAAVMDLANAGQTNAEALARYAVSCGLSAYQRL